MQCCKLPENQKPKCHADGSIKLWFSIFYAFILKAGSSNLLFLQICSWFMHFHMVSHWGTSSLFTFVQTRKKYEFSQFLSVLRFTGYCAKKRRKKGEFVLVLISMVAGYMCTEKTECVCMCVCARDDWTARIGPLPLRVAGALPLVSGTARFCPLTLTHPSSVSPRLVSSASIRRSASIASSAQRDTGGALFSPFHGLLPPVSWALSRGADAPGDTVSVAPQAQCNIRPTSSSPLSPSSAAPQPGSTNLFKLTLHKK